MQSYVVHAALLLAFIGTLVAWVTVKLYGVDAGPLDELLLVLGGAIAGAAVPRGAPA